MQNSLDCLASFLVCFPTFSDPELPPGEAAGDAHPPLLLQTLRFDGLRRTTSDWKLARRPSLVLRDPGGALSTLGIKSERRLSQKNCGFFRLSCLRRLASFYLMPRLRILFPARDYACIPLSGRRCDRLPRGSAWRGRAGARDAQLDRRLGAPSGPVHARLSATSTPTQLYFERDPTRVSCVLDAGVTACPIRAHHEAVRAHRRRGRAACTQVGASPRPRPALLLTYSWPRPLEPTQPDGRVPHPGRRSERLQRGVA